MQDPHNIEKYVTTRKISTNYSGGLQIFIDAINMLQEYSLKDSYIVFVGGC